MSKAVCPLWLGMLLVGCLNPTELGSLPALEGGVEDPRVAALREKILGRWCGSAYLSDVSDVFGESIEMVFENDTYVVECDCGFPFPAEQAVEGESSRYRVNEVTLNGEGWGRAEQVVVGGGISQVRLEHIVVDGDAMRFERRAELSPRRVFVELTRCP